MVGPSHSDLECMKILLPGLYAETLKLPTAMARAIRGHRKLELCLDDKRSLARQKVEVFPDGGHLYLHQGWKHFACALDLQDGFSLLLWYDGLSQINIKVFDLTTCRKQYPHDFEADGSQLSLPITEPRSFAVIPKKYHLKAKYLAKNVPVDFERAHDYKQRCMVELQMAGQSWFVGLERTCTNKVLRVPFKYGWGTFCADNNLNIGDTCFFSVIREATCSNDDNEEREEELEDNEAKHKVEVC